MRLKELIMNKISRKYQFTILYIIIFFIFVSSIYLYFDIHLVQKKSEETPLLEIENIVNSQRAEIKKELENYEYPNGKYRLNISLDELVLERGGRPLRSVVIANWRTGSSFFSDIINSHPTTFYHLEPLSDFGTIRIRGPPKSQTALTNIRAFFNCEYHKLGHFLDPKYRSIWCFVRNTRLWKQCEAHKNLCFDPLFLQRFCRLFPFQLIKFTRLTLNVSQALLEDKSLGVRMVYLVRDPRGSLQSRRHLEFCKNQIECLDPTFLCNDMVSDYEVAVQLKDKYPRHFKVIRFEDIAAEPFSKAKEIFKFYGLNFHSDVEKFLMTHTNSHSNDSFSTYRNTKNVPYHWRSDLTFNEVKQIQNVCSVAIKLWGYNLASNETHLKTFNPIDDNYRF